MYLLFGVAVFLIKSREDVVITEYLADESVLLSLAYLTITNILLTLSSYSLERAERIEWIHDKQLYHEQKTLEQILNNLLPNHVTEKLRNGENMIAESWKECSILFSDLVSFTRYSSRMPAQSLIQRLHELYTVFDELCATHNVYKVLFYKF